MFNWDFNKRQDRVKLFFLILGLFLIIGYGITYFSWSFQGMGQAPKTEAQEKPSTDKQVTVKDGPEEDLSKKKIEDKTQSVQPFTKKQIKESQEVAASFAKAFYTYDSNQPKAYLKHSKPYMTKDFYERIKPFPRRQILDRVKTTVQSTKILPATEDEATDIRWVVIVQGKAMNVEGKKHQEENWYIVSMNHIRGEWKVTGVEVDAPN